MRLVTIDFETYYSKEYSLSKIGTDEYVHHPDFEVIGFAWKEGDGDTGWVSGDHTVIQEALDDLELDTAAVLCHNTAFDGYILSRVFHQRPKLWLDTLSMGRALYPWLKSHSLANLAREFHMGEKGTEVLNAIGLRRADFAPYQLAAYGEYCKNDVALTSMLGHMMLPCLPSLELRLIDMTIRHFTEPQFVGDAALLEKGVNDEVARKEKLLESTVASREDLMSNPKFARMLEGFGISPPRKVSATTGKETWAFAKSDKEFTALLEDEDPQVQALVAARLGVKTTIAETRARRMLGAAQRADGSMPIMLHYWGAKTTGRFSGGNGVNYQNLPGRMGDKTLRNSLRAPKGYKVVVGDSSNIELRVAMVAAGQQNIVEQLFDGEDVYCSFATHLCGRIITKADKDERMLGKVAMLMLQYGAGWEKFKETARLQAKILLNDMEAQDVVQKYRTFNNEIYNIWQHMQYNIIPDIAKGTSLLPVDRAGWCLTMNEGFAMPGHPGVVYKGLRQNQQTQEWEYIAGNAYSKIYGGKSFENFSQHMARNIVMFQADMFNRIYPVALTVHDEIVAVVPEAQAKEAEAYLLHCLKTSPPWAPGIPLTGETGIGDSYGEAK